MKIWCRSYNEETLDLRAPEFLSLVTKISSDQINLVNDHIYIYLVVRLSGKFL